MSALEPKLRKLARQSVRLAHSQESLARVMDLLATNEGDIRKILSAMPNVKEKDLRKAFHDCAQLLRHLEGLLGLPERPESSAPPEASRRSARFQTTLEPLLPEGKKPKRVNVYIDGSSKGNPGPSACGIVFCDEKNNVFWQTNRPLGEMTNNMAEYHALLFALELALEHGWSSVHVFSDSQLLVNQMSGKYRIKKAELQQMAGRVAALIRQCQRFRITHIPREQNTVADGLANAALKE